MTSETNELDDLIAVARKHDHPSVFAQESAWASLSSAIDIGAPHPVLDQAPARTANGAAGLGTKAIVALVVTGTAVAMALVLADSGSADLGPSGAGGSLSGPQASVDPGDAETPPAPVRLDPAAARPSIVVDDLAVPALEPAAPPRAPGRPAPPKSESKLEPKPRRVAAADRTAPRPAKPVPRAGSTLAEQARLLGRAWRAADAGEVTLSRRLVAEHARRFPASPLAPERDACELVARCLADDLAAAAEARTFVSTHRGALAKRVQLACGKIE